MVEFSLRNLNLGFECKVVLMSNKLSSYKPTKIIE
jgi:hypothetical protein